jgi:ketosteroid isomerase-like protein
LSDDDLPTATVARRVRAALEGGDPSQWAALLDPDVRWGAPGDPSPPCQNRQQVIEWYRRARDEGTVGTVTDVVAAADKVVVSMTVRAPSPGGVHEVERWQVLTVANGRITDIRGYDDRAEALTAAGLPVDTAASGS